MGDVLMNLPAIRVLRKACPKAWITLLLDKSLQGLLDGHPDLDELLYVDAAALRTSGAARSALRRQIRAARFDLVFISNPEKWSHSAAFWAGIPERVGYRRKWGFLLTRALDDRKAFSGLHETRLNLDLVGQVVCSQWDGKWEMPRDERAEKSVNQALADSNPKEVIVLHGGTSNPAKRWGPERFAEVADHFENRGYRTALIGGAEEKAVSSQIARASRHTPLDITGQLDLAELSAFFRHDRVKLLISCDSGPVHVAWIQGLPVVAIYSSDAVGSDPARWGPLDAKSRTLHASPASLTAAQVIAAAEKALKK